MDIRKLQEGLEEVIFTGQAQKIGIFSELNKQEDTSEGLAQRMQLDKRCTFILLEALVEMNYLNKTGDVYSVPQEAYNRLVDKEGPEYEGDFWQFLLYLIEPWKTLPYVLKNGIPDEGSYEHLSIQEFIRGMNSPWKKKLAGEIIDLCLKHHNTAKSVIDVGGAPGTMAREFASRGLDTVIYDLPECADVMYDELIKIKNIRIEKGDATKSLPQEKFDIAFLGNLCHGQSPEDNASIIKMCHENLNDNGILVIFDNIRNNSYLGNRLALHMMTQSPKGDIYTKDEYFKWIEKAGFKAPVTESLSEKAWNLIIAEK